MAFQLREKGGFRLPEFLKAFSGTVGAETGKRGADFGKRNRQIRRMCAQCELEVLRLQRVRAHCLELGALPLGQWRYLTAEEIAGLKEE